MRHRLLAVLVVALAALGGCGDDDDAASDGASVTIEGSRYDPAEITVAPGTEVTFENLDLASHTVTAADGSPSDFSSGSLGQDATFAHVFDEPGTHDYFCEIHPSMQGSVVVEG